MFAKIAHWIQEKKEIVVFYNTRNSFIQQGKSGIFAAKKIMAFVLVACEESQAVCKAFREAGHIAFSCDIIPCSGGHPEWHFLEDAISVMKNKGGHIEVGMSVYIDNPKWDLIIAHPPCTFLSSSGATWYYHPEDKELPVEQRRPHPLYPNRRQDQKEAIGFFMEFTSLEHTDRWCIENPIGVMSKQYRKPDCIIQPWQFGHEASKSTCLWLHNLPVLEPTNIVGKGEFIISKSGNKMPKWYADAWGSKDRRTIRSKTFEGIAKAMAEQWGGLL